MFRFLVAAAALCAAGAASAAVDIDLDDGFDGTTFAEERVLPLEQNFYPAFAGQEDVLRPEAPVGLQLEDYVVIFKGERPSAVLSGIGYPFADENIDNAGLTFGQSYLLATVSSSIDDRVNGLVWLPNGLAMTPADYAAEMGGVSPVPEPHEWAMIAAGMGVVGFAAKRRKLSGIE